MHMFMLQMGVDQQRLAVHEDCSIKSKMGGIWRTYNSKEKEMGCRKKKLSGGGPGFRNKCDVRGLFENILMKNIQN